MSTDCQSRRRHAVVHLVLWTAASVILSGCAVSQSKLDANVSRAAKESLPRVSEAWRAAVDSGPVQPGWLASFGDPVLEELVAEAQAKNPGLAAAAAGVEQARALARQAGANLAPQMGFGADATRVGGLEGSSRNQFGVGLDVSWEVDLWGRIRAGTAQAAASAEAAEADYRFAQASIAANTALAYFTAIEAGLQLVIAEDNRAIIERTGRIVQAQYEEGVASSQDLALARSDLAAAEERLIALEASARDAQRALELLLGRYPRAEIEVRDALPQLPPSPPAGLPSELLERRPDLIAAERRVAAAFNAIEQARTARLPSIGLNGSLGGASSELSSLLNSSNVAWSLGTSLLAPILDGGRRRMNVVISTAEQQRALAEYASIAIRAFFEVERGLDQGQTLVDRVERLTESANQAVEAFRVADIRYREGESSLIDLLDIQQRANSALSNLATLERLLLQQRVELGLALGGSWQAPH